MGFFRPIEGHLVADREEQCSTQVEPSSTQPQQTPTNEAINTPSQEQIVDPQVDEAAFPRANNPAPTSGVSVPMDPTVKPSAGVSPHGDQDQHNDDNDAQGNDQGLPSGQDGDSNDQDDQYSPPRNNDEIEARREARMRRALKNIDVSLDKVAEKLQAKRTTRSELARFSEHHAHISMVEPKKVFEALEDHDWVEAVHEIGRAHV